MQIIRTIEALRQALAPLRQGGKRIGFVPTMGYLHKGHLELVHRARAENEVSVVSIFVNPLQFGANEDLDKYPRDLERDANLLRGAGVDFLFAPEVSDMYPRPMQTVVDVPQLGNQMEGEARPGHFAGVATVVSKLFNIVGPDAAYFGERIISSSPSSAVWWKILPFRCGWSACRPCARMMVWPARRAMSI